MGNDRWKKAKEAILSPKKKSCGICQNKMIPDQGYAVFIAECKHYFHHNCITSNMTQGNRVCPICRATWTAVPYEIRTPNAPEYMRANFVTSNINYQQLQDPQPITYDDDDNLIEHQSTDPLQEFGEIINHKMEIMTFPDFPAIPKSATCDDFTILINLKALTAEPPSRPPVDLVTVLDVSSSMAGRKIALLKQVMGLVIQNMGPRDRLSVIAFSSVARRLLPLRRMTDTGRHQAVQAVDSLMSSGGTDIAEALKIAVKVILERRSKNPGCGIILFSDGLDTYTITGPTGQSKSLIPNSIGQIPVHTIGFGEDCDNLAMQLISLSSGGAFMFISHMPMWGDEEFVQYAMGGVLTVVASKVTVSIECVDPSLVLNSINAGNYPVVMRDDVRKGDVKVGDFYAQEERDILVTMNIPESTDDKMILLKIYYRYPATYNQEFLRRIVVRIDRPGEGASWRLDGSIEVDRQRNRVRAAKATSDAQSAAGRGDFGIAKSILERCHGMMSDSMSVRSGDELSVGLVKELREMRERMANRQVYEAYERGYVWSGLGSQSQQRPATGSASPSQVNQQITAVASSDNSDLVDTSLRTLFQPR